MRNFAVLGGRFGELSGCETSRFWGVFWGTKRLRLWDSFVRNDLRRVFSSLPVVLNAKGALILLRN